MIKMYRLERTQIARSFGPVTLKQTATSIYLSSKLYLSLMLNQILIKRIDGSMNKRFAFDLARNSQKGIFIHM